MPTPLFVELLKFITHGCIFKRLLYTITFALNSFCSLLSSFPLSSFSVYPLSSLLPPLPLPPAVDTQAETTAEMETLTRNLLLVEQQQQRISSSSPESDHSSGPGMESKHPRLIRRSKDSTSSLGSVVDPVPWVNGLGDRDDVIMTYEPNGGMMSLWCITKCNGMVSLWCNELSEGGMMSLWYEPSEGGMMSWHELNEGMMLLWRNEWTMMSFHTWTKEITSFELIGNHHSLLSSSWFLAACYRRRGRYPAWTTTLVWGWMHRLRTGSTPHGRRTPHSTSESKQMGDHCEESGLGVVFRRCMKDIHVEDDKSLEINFLY